MNKRFLLFTAKMLSISLLSAQQVAEVIQAEKSFALYALEHNTKAAFLQYMDSNAVVFDKGQVLNAKKVWTANAGSSGKLLWKPAFAGLAKSGDLGFTTGPWEFKQSLNDTAIAVGEFATVWRKTAAGEWKFLVDLGVTLKKPLYTFRKIQIASKGKKSKADTSAFFQLERNLNTRYREAGPDVLVKAVMNDCWMVVKEQPPLKGVDSIDKHLNEVMPANVQFRLLTGGISSSGDLAYAYGNLTYPDRQENYLRVWLNTNTGWRILLMVIQ